MDDLEKAGFWVRLVVGGILGAAGGGLILWGGGFETVGMAVKIAIVVGLATVCAFLAVKFGDRFFHIILDMIGDAFT